MQIVSDFSKMVQKQQEKQKNFLYNDAGGKIRTNAYVK